MKIIKVMVIDDSAVVREVMKDVLGSVPGIQVIGVAPDPLFAAERMKQVWPDVIILDVEMPRMDGITFLRKVMSQRPTPTIICSSLTEAGTKTASEAIAAGAIEIITKPKLGLKHFLSDSRSELIRVVKAAALVNLRHLKTALGQKAQSTEVAPVNRAKANSIAMHQTTNRVIAIGTSTGGTQALERVVSELPVDIPGIVVVQHMPEKFTAMFADRLNALYDLDVKEAADGDRVLDGRVLIAPGGRHMKVVRSGAQYRVQVFDGPTVNRHRPSVDVLFDSVAECVGRNALGIIMTGMGDDGARGIKRMYDAGARTIAEDESTCIVFGMPKVAIELGGITDITPLSAISAAIRKFGGES